MSDDKKPWWQSKTIWVNAALAAGATVWQHVAGTLDPEIAAAAVAVINILLRTVTAKGLK